MHCEQTFALSKPSFELGEFIILTVSLALVSGLLRPYL